MLGWQWQLIPDPNEPAICRWDWVETTETTGTEDCQELIIPSKIEWDWIPTDPVQ